MSSSDGCLILVRHLPIDAKFQGLCYGQSDVPPACDNELASSRLIDEISVLRPDRIVHSGLKRTFELAERLANRLGVSADCAFEIQERNFGSWELQSWDAIYQQYGDDMLRMVSEPESFRPGGGETTFELRDRVIRWFRSVPDEGLTIALTHGGPIAALLGTLQGVPVSEWPALIPQCGRFVRIEMTTAARLI